MKIISWNCNGAFRKKFKFLFEYHPDVLVVSESESPHFLKEHCEGIPCSSHVWDGDRVFCGLSIFTFNDYHAEIPDFYNREFKLVLPVMVSNGKESFLLIAVWAKAGDSSKYSYVFQAYRAMCYYEKYFKYNTVIIGDFNSNAIWNHRRHCGVNHELLVQRLNHDEFDSVYHLVRNEEQGKESQSTLFFRRNKDLAYHIDYAFLHRNMIPQVADFQVGQYSDWGGISDHMPLFLNLRDQRI